jgi:hypothetical protein
MWRAGLLGGLLLVLMCVSPVASADLDPDYTCTGPGPSNYHEGQLRSQGSDLSWRGAIATIYDRSGSACTPSSPGDSFSSSWLMLQDDTGLGYAQIGYDRNDSNPSCHCERYFWEYEECGACGFVRALWGTPVIDNTVGFKVDWQVNDGKIHIQYDTNLDGIYELPPNNAHGDAPITPFNPGTSWAVQVPYFSEEIIYQLSVYKGSSGLPTVFANMEMRQSGGSHLWISTDMVSQSSSWKKVSDMSTKGFQTVAGNDYLQVWN